MSSSRMTIQKVSIGVAGAAATALVLSGCGGEASASGSTDYPAETLEMAIPGGPGGGNDIMMRELAQILQSEDIYPERIDLSNRLQAGGGTTAWRDLHADAGNAYQMSSTSSSFVIAPILGLADWTYDDFTPIALLAQDDSLFVTNVGESMDTWDEWEAYAAGRDKVTVGGVGATGADFVRQISLAEQAGYDVDYVPFDDDGKLINGLLSDSVDMIIASPGKIVGQIEAGTLSAVMWTGPSPLGDLPDVPTTADAGFDSLPGTPRGLLLPAEVDPAVVDWWQSAIEDATETDQWQEYIEANSLTADVRYGDDFTEFLNETASDFERILDDQGML